MTLEKARTGEVKGDCSKEINRRKDESAPRVLGANARGESAKQGLTCLIEVEEMKGHEARMWWLKARERQQPSQ